jgi:hypothetical protein
MQLLLFKIIVQEFSGFFKPKRFKGLISDSEIAKRTGLSIEDVKGFQKRKNMYCN